MQLHYKEMTSYLQSNNTNIKKIFNVQLNLLIDVYFHAYLLCLGVKKPHIFNLNKKLSYRRETSRQLCMST